MSLSNAMDYVSFIRGKFEKEMAEYGWQHIDWTQYFQNPSQVIPDLLLAGQRAPTAPAFSPHAGDVSMHDAEKLADIDQNSHYDEEDEEYRGPRRVLVFDDVSLDGDDKQEVEGTPPRRSHHGSNEISFEFRSPNSIAVDESVVIELSSDEEDEETAATGSPHNNSNQRHRVSNSKRNPIVIDLDDSPSPPPQRGTAGRPAAAAAVSSSAIPPAPARQPRLASTNESSKKFAKQRETLLRQLYEEYNSKVWNNRLYTFDNQQKIVPAAWSARLTKSAGHCRCSRIGSLYKAEIEISTKVVDNMDRLKKTLAHEMCHAAAWLLEGQVKPPHGTAFQKQVRAFNRIYPNIEITTCHNYEIAYKYEYQCSSCHRFIKRHSKLNLEKDRCKQCGGMLLVTFQPASASRPESAYNAYVRQNYAAVQARLPPGTPSKDVLKELAAEYKRIKSTTLS